MRLKKEYRNIMLLVNDALSEGHEKLTKDELGSMFKDHKAIRDILWKYVDQEDKDRADANFKEKLEGTIFEQA